MTEIMPPVAPSYDMMTASPDAKFTDTLAKIVFGAPAHPDAWNGLFEPLLGNTGYLKGRADKADARLDGLDVAISDVINASAIGITKVVTLQSELSSVRFAAELFLDGWRLVDSVAVPVTDSRAGDESIDVTETTSLQVGQSYVITDSLGSVIITIAAILDGTRIRADADMPRTFAADAVLARTNWACFDQYAEAPAGGVYFSRPLNLGWDKTQPRTLIIRSSANSAPEVAFKDESHPNWTDVPWAWRRATDGHFEYAVPATGEFVLRITNTAPLRVAWMFATSAPSQLGGTAAPPMPPRLTLPADGAVGVSETPTLTTAGFVSATGLTMAAAEWQVKRKTDEDWDNPLWSSTTTTTSARMPAGVLAVNLAVTWRCRMQDSQGQWSDWAQADFTCAPEFKYIKTPTITAPADGLADVNAEAALTLTGSAFAVTGGSDSFVAQQWQIADGLGVVWTSDEVTINGNVTLPADTLQPGWKSYTVQVRHKGAVLGWSEWSDPVTVITKGYNLPPATTTEMGGVKLATSTEAQAGTDNTKAMTPATTAAAISKYAADNPIPVAPGIATATKAGLVKGSDTVTVSADGALSVKAGATTIVTITSSQTWTAPVTGSYRVTCLGGGGGGASPGVAGTAGGKTSFGAYVSANGGGGAPTGCRGGTGGWAGAAGYNGSNGGSSGGSGGGPGGGVGGALSGGTGANASLSGGGGGGGGGNSYGGVTGGGGGGGGYEVTKYVSLTKGNTVAITIGAGGTGGAASSGGGGGAGKAGSVIIEY